jgi:putative SOS response-associated peptidase YedK
MRIVQPTQAFTDGLLMFAGVWERRESKEAEPLYTYTIVTGPPGIVSGDVHDRAPVIFAPDVWNDWLRAEPDQTADLLRSAKERWAQNPAVTRG